MCRIQLSHTFSTLLSPERERECASEERPPLILSLSREARKARILANPAAYPRAHRLLTRQRAAAAARRSAREEARRQWREGIQQGPHDQTTTRYQRAAEVVRTADVDSAEWVRGFCTLVVESLGWTVAPRVLGVHVNALTSVVIAGREDVILPSYIRRRISALMMTCGLRPWRELVSPRYEYEEDGSETRLRPLATYLGIPERMLGHSRARSPKIWRAIKATVRKVRAMISWLYDSLRPRWGCYVEYTWRSGHYHRVQNTINRSRVQNASIASQTPIKQAPIETEDQARKREVAALRSRLDGLTRSLHDLYAEIQEGRDESTADPDETAEQWLARKHRMYAWDYEKHAECMKKLAEYTEKEKSSQIDA